MSENQVSLRDFVERVIHEGDRRRDEQREADRRWIERAFSDSAKALELQAGEYERRLELLNHAHAEAQRVLHTYVLQSVYEKDQTAFRELKTRVDEAFAGWGGRASGFHSLASWIATLALVISVFVAILTYTK